MAFTSKELTNSFYLLSFRFYFQLIELFDLTDEEVVGYIPSTSLVDWHLEFRHCAIHYRYKRVRAFSLG